MVYSAQQIGIYGGMIVSYITMEIWTGIWILVRFLTSLDKGTQLFVVCDG